MKFLVTPGKRALMSSPVFKQNRYKAPVPCLRNKNKITAAIFKDY